MTRTRPRWVARHVPYLRNNNRIHAIEWVRFVFVCFERADHRVISAQPHVTKPNQRELCFFSRCFSLREAVAQLRSQWIYLMIRNISDKTQRRMYSVISCIVRKKEKEPFWYCGLRNEHFGVKTTTSSKAHQSFNQSGQKAAKKKGESCKKVATI